MARIRTDDYDKRREQIIDGALEAFASKGIEKATNRDIAGAAGIGSPGLIYHYFKDKADLLKHVIEGRVPLLKLVSDPGDLYSLPVRDALHKIGKSYLALLEIPIAGKLLRIIVSEVIRNPRMAHLFIEMGPIRVFSFLADYLQHQMDQGIIKKVDPYVAVRSFMGPLIIYVASRLIFELPEAISRSPDDNLEMVIDIFMNGLSAD